MLGGGMKILHIEANGIREITQRDSSPRQVYNRRYQSTSSTVTTSDRNEAEMHQLFVVSISGPDALPHARRRWRMSTAATVWTRAAIFRCQSCTHLTAVYCNHICNMRQNTKQFYYISTRDQHELVGPSPGQAVLSNPVLLKSNKLTIVTHRTKPFNLYMSNSYKYTIINNDSRYVHSNLTVVHSVQANGHCSYF